jgi:hypothetical protein
MDVLRHCQAENARLRELYENVTGNRERFGWTINHLLECEEALRVAEEQLAGAVEALREIKRVAAIEAPPVSDEVPAKVWKIAFDALNHLGGQ